MESGKDDNVIWPLEVCQIMLKDQENMTKFIVTDRDTALTNSVAKVFSTSYVLLCMYHITKNMRGSLKPAAGTKQVNGEDEKMVKASVILKSIMDV